MKSIPFLSRILFLLALTVLFSTCKKEYSYENGGTPSAPPPSGPPPGTVNASFILSGSPGDCTGAYVNGKYLPGTALTASNTVDLEVLVTEPGNYSIQTETIGGMKFSASGTFTTAGTQSVTLKGSGTPDGPGNYRFKPDAAGMGCTFLLTVPPSEPTAGYVLESGGVDHSCTGIDIKGGYTAGTALNSTNTASIRVYVGSVGNYFISTNTVNGMNFTAGGTFTSTGTQLVTLNGHGTPAAVGIFTLTPEIVGPHPLGGETCNIVVEVK
ncbi:MAG TPA: hypothetical protein VHK91_00755 [Flavisolibacter sp.]|jgi:hypothetical protein|nr:hypothetical protein [Flavisolibacter sp.]